MSDGGVKSDKKPRHAFHSKGIAVHIKQPCEDVFRLAFLKLNASNWLSPVRPGLVGGFLSNGLFFPQALVQPLDSSDEVEKVKCFAVLFDPFFGGPLIITYPILGDPYDNYSIMGPKEQADFGIQGFGQPEICLEQVRMDEMFPCTFTRRRFPAALNVGCSSVNMRNDATHDGFCLVFKTTHFSGSVDVWPDTVARISSTTKL